MQPILELGFSKQKRNKPTETTLLVLLPENYSLLIAPSTSANCKVSRPSFISLWGIVTIEKHTPLALVIDIIIEQVGGVTRWFIA
ncbi:hypothetical protein K1719_011205 [Acacia pycnantha]|nr:hypothetical protein K1719_011205 [Acacia pycnantha]